MSIPAKKKAILERIRGLDLAALRAQEYLATGSHADWSGFRPLFVAKTKDGAELPPHPDWVANVFLPHVRRRLLRAEKALKVLEMKESEMLKGTRAKSAKQTR
jgi:hypothetical protein